MQTNAMAPAAGVAPVAGHAAARQARIAALEQDLALAAEDARIMLYYRLGCLALAVGEVRTRALDAFSRMRDLAVERGDERGEGLAQVGLACVLDLLGCRHDALSAALRAERLAEATGDQQLFGLALNQQGQFYKESGDNPRALALFERVQAIGIALDDKRLVLAGLIGRGRTTPMAEPAAAMGYYEQAITLAGALGDEETLSLCYNNLADWQINTGHYDEAIRLRETSLRISREYGDREGVGRALIGLGKAYTLLDDEPRAWDYLNRGLPVVVGVGDLEGELHTYLNLAHLFVRRADIPRAVDYYQRALEKSLADPDAACALFAQRALDQLAAGDVPRPAILPPAPLTAATLAAPRPQLLHTYQTGDRAWHGLQG
jgi:tetratricopeptide (TPR) repeat protein